MSTQRYTSTTPGHPSRLARRLLAASLMLLPLTACTPESEAMGEAVAGSESGSESESESEWDYTTKLQSCGLVTDGTMFGDGLGLDESTLCYFNCLAEGTCEQLETMVCGDEFDSYELQAACLYTCQPASFVCGTGEQIPGEWKCDFEPDCEDASDEAYCGEPQYFTCGDGEQIVAYWQCDEYPDCADGSDELDCAQMLCN